MTSRFIWENPLFQRKPAKTAEPPVFAIIAAAGSGSRMGLALNKQFLKIGGIPVIVRSLNTLDRMSAISGLVVVAAAGDCAAMRDLLSDCRYNRLMGVTAGGATRQESVARGLETLKTLADPPADSTILIHDGARCFVTTAVVERVIAGIRQHRACGAAVPVKDTIKVADASGQVITTPERSGLWAMQTPQGALWHVLDKAYRLAGDRLSQATDDLAVLEQAGQPVYLVLGDYANIKITTPEDLPVGEWLAAHQERG